MLRAPLRVKHLLVWIYAGRCASMASRPLAAGRLPQRSAGHLAAGHLTLLQSQPTCLGAVYWIGCIATMCCLLGGNGEKGLLGCLSGRQHTHANTCTHARTLNHSLGMAGAGFQQSSSDGWLVPWTSALAIASPDASPDVSWGCCRTWQECELLQLQQLHALCMCQAGS